MTPFFADTFVVATGASQAPLDVLELLESFAHLQFGWHFGEGTNADSATVESAKKFAEIAAINGWEMEAFPGISGDITLACYREEFELEIIVKAVGGFTLTGLVDDIRVERDADASLAVITDRLAFFGSCNTYDFYTPVIGVEENPNFQELLSEISHLPEFPLSDHPAPLQADMERYADISRTITKIHPPRLSSGYLKRRDYRNLIQSTTKSLPMATNVITTSMDFPTLPLKSISRTIFTITDGQTSVRAPVVRR